MTWDAAFCRSVLTASDDMGTENKDIMKHAYLGEKEINPPTALKPMPRTVPCTFWDLSHAVNFLLHTIVGSLSSMHYPHSTAPGGFPAALMPETLCFLAVVFLDG